MKPIVAIVGRPNVGKSTFFNRITKTRQALVDNFPGVTRDRHYHDATWNDIEFTLVDTGGFIVDPSDQFTSQIREQVQQAINDADLVVMILDGKHGISPFDSELIQILRSIDKPVLYAVNKVDGIEQEHLQYEFYQLGISPLFSFSAEHGYGINDFLDELVKHLPKSDQEESLESLVKVAVVGRPNVGKSSLINAILKENRLLVSDIPGTTRDSIDTLVKIKDTPYLMIDTAGIRKKSKVSRKLEKLSIIKSLKSLDRCDIALIVIDADDGITDQDIKIAGYAFERKCGCIFLLNKWDLIEKDSKTLRRFTESVKDQAKFLSFAPVLSISALKGTRVNKIFSIVSEVFRQYNTRIGTGMLNRYFQQAILRTEPSLHKGRRIKFYYATQTASKPPTIVCFVNYPDAVHFSYKRYLINQIRQSSGLDKTPIDILFRQR